MSNASPVGGATERYSVKKLFFGASGIIEATSFAGPFAHHPTHHHFRQTTADGRVLGDWSPAIDGWAATSSGWIRSGEAGDLIQVPMLTPAVSSSRYRRLASSFARATTSDIARCACPGSIPWWAMRS